MNRRNWNLKTSIDYSYCDLCALNGYSDEKVTYEYEGLRSENQDGFIYKFRVFDYYYPARKKKIKHIHKCNLKLIDELVSLALKQREVMAS
jgi:hypothetical protein